MATNPPDFQVPDGEPAAPETNPWENWQSAGIDPSYDPGQARQALSFWDALSNRDQREYAVEQIVRNELPEGMTWREVKEIARQQAAAAQPDPWENVMGQPQEEQYYEPQAQAIDPAALRAALRAEMEQEFSQRDQAAAQQRQQEEFQAEFTRETEKAVEKQKLSKDWMPAIAAEANLLHQHMPYATTEQLVEAAGVKVKKQLLAQIHALSQMQDESPAAPLPGGATPSAQQVPQNAREAQDAAKNFFVN
jgi:hypothetical protein